MPAFTLVIADGLQVCALFFQTLFGWDEEVAFRSPICAPQSTRVSTCLSSPLLSPSSAASTADPTRPIATRIADRALNAPNATLGFHGPIAAELLGLTTRTNPSTGAASHPRHAAIMSAHHSHLRTLVAHQFP